MPTFCTKLTAPVIIVLCITGIGALAARPAGAQECVDFRSGGELTFKGSGTPNHFAAVEDVVCPGAGDRWSFSTVGEVHFTEHIGILITGLEGDMEATVELPAGGEAQLQAGVAYRAVHEYNVDGPSLAPVEYNVTVIERGDGHATYRLDVCRGIAPCTFGQPGQPPGPPPGPLSPPDDLSPPIVAPTPRECITPVNLSPPRDVGCLILPASGQAGNASSNALGMVVLAIAGAALFTVVGSLAFAFRRDP